MFSVLNNENIEEPDFIIKVSWLHSPFWPSIGAFIIVILFINGKHCNQMLTVFVFIFPGKEYVRLVYDSHDDDNLWTADNVKSMCRIEKDLLGSFSDYQEYCHQDQMKMCCRSWSLGNYVAMLNNKSDCLAITEDDMASSLQLLKQCSGFYRNSTLSADCEATDNAREIPRHCRSIPTKCREHNAVYYILDYITDAGFLHDSENTELKLAMSFLPVTANEKSAPLYEHIKNNLQDQGEIKIVAAKFGIKDFLFQQHLQKDMMWLVCASCVIFLIMWMYTTSLLITIMAFLAIFWSLEVAYFIYVLVFEIKFFPYMNLATIIIMVGLTADDVFIYTKMWQIGKSERNNGTFEKIVSDTLKHASLSMFVTSITTAAAFFANYISTIIAIRCFSIFAGMAVLVNFVLMVTWLPATIVIYEKWCNCCVCYSDELSSTSKSICNQIWKFPFYLLETISKWSSMFFDNMLPKLVIKLRFLWLITLGCLGICGTVVIFYHPKLRLPSSHKFQVFSSDHLFEQYDFVYGQEFGFEQNMDKEAPLMPLRMIWGVHASDDGHVLDPDNRGSLQFDFTFELETGQAQRWLLDFCQRLRSASFYQPYHGYQITNCFLENFKVFMNHPCGVGTFAHPCCNESSFPFSRDVIARCMAIYVQALWETPGINYNTYSPGPRFSNGRISAFIVEFWSNQKYTYSYEKMKEFYQDVNRWMIEEMLNAPIEMRNGWFVSDLSFYDLQNSLMEGTPLAIGISLAVTAVVTFFTSLNVLISFYAIITIAFVLFVTVGTLVLLNWELNIIESVVITVAIGMSIDYTLHYGVAYRLSPGLDRKKRVFHSMELVGKVIFLAAITTFLAGAFMLPSTVLVYQKFGIFIMLIISISWIYSTFFFQSLLAIFGPEGGFGQFHCPGSDCCSNTGHEHVDKTIYTMSESTLSTSSTNPNQTSSEVHELEPLTETSDILSQTPSHHHHHHRSRSKSQYIRTRNVSVSPELPPKHECRVTFHPETKSGPSRPLRRSHSCSDKGETKDRTVPRSSKRHLSDSGACMIQTDIY